MKQPHETTFSVVASSAVRSLANAANDRQESTPDLSEAILNRASVTGVRSVDLAVPDLEAARAFFTDVWHLQEVASAGGIVYLRATGPCFHVLSLRAAPAAEAGLVRVVMQAR